MKKEVVIVFLHYSYSSYLLQLRDFKPSIDYPGQWGTFGGGVEKNETIDSAVYRELLEELHYVPPSTRKIRTYTTDNLVCHSFCCDLKVPLSDLVLSEGLDMGLFTMDEILSERLYSQKYNKHFPMAHILIEYFKDLFDFIALAR
jgi:8-oxo-dGTP pyrophosphatase MutT (NUDIX family)|tara:strand:- start:1958 stop:2392 length:435 start_codon:yes stop_codon:yes gene_type:complete